MAGDACEAMLERLQTYLDGECPGDIEAGVAQHLRDCPPCLERADFERRLREIVAQKCRDVAPAGLIDKVLGRLGT